MIATTDARGEEWGVENTVRSRFRREGERVRWKVDSRVEYKVILAGLLERIEPGNKRRRAKKGFRELYAFPRWKFIQKKRGGGWSYYDVAERSLSLGYVHVQPCFAIAKNGFTFFLIFVE